jgi:hypothetical protein
MRTFRRLRIGQRNAFGNSTTPDKSKSKSSILEMIKLNPGNLYSLSPSSEVDYEHSWGGSPDFPGKIFMSKRKREVFRRQFLGGAGAVFVQAAASPALQAALAGAPGI